ncbi:ABC transporter ATP-binding protein [Devosia algicola]|uniref:ABC transporter ATP-binding protein n=1 Tax=Devosia algicola TaxID=3026418 RepID=A0ABY7YTD7_9HYPH|nr:ABC transporter ATP-binding protein [Devosia algicola]WDR04300.1 ABC transporter ATP-binding protein [Devosia algicola]
MTKSSFLVLDEPVSALDVSVQAQVLNLLIDLQRERDLTYLFISHDLSVVRNIASRVGVMYMGQFCEIADVSEIFARPRHHYTHALFEAVPKMARRSRPKVAVLGEAPNAAAIPSGCRFHPRCPAAQHKCTIEKPVLRTLSKSHQVACHYPID